jgi:hypothetical protein
MCFGGPKIPAATPPPAQATEQDPAVSAALDADRKRRVAAGGYNSTILTGGLGVPSAPSTAQNMKTLLGS